MIINSKIVTNTWNVANAGAASNGRASSRGMAQGPNTSQNLIGNSYGGNSLVDGFLPTPGNQTSQNINVIKISNFKIRYINNRQCQKCVLFKAPFLEVPIFLYLALITPTSLLGHKLSLAFHK